MPPYFNLNQEIHAQNNNFVQPQPNSIQNKNNPIGCGTVPGNLVCYNLPARNNCLRSFITFLEWNLWFAAFCIIFMINCYLLYTMILIKVATSFGKIFVIRFTELFMYIYFVICSSSERECIFFFKCSFIEGEIQFFMMLLTK